MKFSIVIPTYKRAHVILKTLDYVLNQTYKNYEVIIVDNHSEDGTEEVLKGVLASRSNVKLIVHDKNYERAVSRNTGMANATGDFLTLLDSDDIIYPYYLEEASNYIKVNPSIHFFHNLHDLRDEKGKQVYKFPFPKIDDSVKHMINGNYLSCNGVFISKDAYTKFRFDHEPSLIGSEDYDFWLRISAYYKAGRINKINSSMINHPNRTINGFTLAKTISQKDYIIQKFKNDEYLNKKYAPFYNRLSASFYLYGAILSNNSKNSFGESINALKKAVSEDIRIIFSKRFLSVLVRTILISFKESVFKAHH